MNRGLAYVIALSAVGVILFVVGMIAANKERKARKQ